MPLLHLESPVGRENVAQVKRGQEPLAPPWVSVPTNSSPLPLTFSPNTKNVLGEREQIVGTLTLGYRLPPRWGAIGKKQPPAAASRTSNLQIPAKTGIQFLDRQRLPPRSRE